MIVDFTPAPGTFLWAVAQCPPNTPVHVGNHRAAAGSVAREVRQMLAEIRERRQECDALRELALKLSDAVPAAAPSDAEVMTLRLRDAQRAAESGWLMEAVNTLDSALLTLRALSTEALAAVKAYRAEVLHQHLVNPPAATSAAASHPAAIRRLYLTALGALAAQTLEAPQ